ncbi:MAG: bile acid:sodium symporter family protein [Eggerthellaceae bacterium]|jgi:BASS family bile acid:Na+ symporter
MKALQKLSQVLSSRSSVFVIAIAVLTLIWPAMMAWVNTKLFVDPLGNGFTWQSLIIGFIMFCMGLTLTKQDFRILAQHPFDICLGAIAQYLIMPFSALFICHLLNLPDALALGLILVGCCPGGVSSNIMSYLCHGDVAYSVGLSTVSTLLAPLMTPFLVTQMANGISIHLEALPMFLSIIETVILPVILGFLLNWALESNATYREIAKCMPGVAVLGLACVVGGVTSSQGQLFFTSGAVIFAAVLLHNGIGYLLGYGAGKLSHMNVPKKRTLSLEVGMQNAGLATNLATTTAQFAAMPQAAIICAVSCVWHSISGTLLANAFAAWDDRKAAKGEDAAKPVAASTAVEATEVASR